jgi:hypothetical protein
MELRNDQGESIDAVYALRLTDMGETMLCMGERLIIRPAVALQTVPAFTVPSDMLVESVRSGNGTEPKDESEE